MATRVPQPALLTHEHLTHLSRPQEGPCLSLYQPTHRRFPENQQDPICFRNLVKDLEASLRQLYPAAATQWLLEPFEALARERAFWNHTLDGLAVLRRPGFFCTYTLPQAFSDLAVVADSFHTKPLRRHLQSTDRFHVLALSLRQVRLFEGNRYALDQLQLDPTAHHMITEALGEALSGPKLTVATDGGFGASSVQIQAGQGGKNDEVELDPYRFFRAVDRAILKYYSRPSGLPLILAALPKHHSLFQELSCNPALLGEGIQTNPDALTHEALRTLAWQVMAPHYELHWAGLIADFEQSRSNGRGSEDLEQIAQAAVVGRIATLLIEADRVVAGRLNTTTGHIRRIDLSHPRVDDLLDDLGELVATTGGRVLVIPAERMVTRSGVAATFRY